MIRPMWNRMRTIPKVYPFAFGVVISTVKTSASDLLVQKVVERKEEIDWKRNMAFATFGCIYLGGFQYFLYVTAFGRMFPNAARFAAKPLREKLTDLKGMATLSGQVFLDQCVHHPLLYFPAFYLVKDFVVNEGNVDFWKVVREYKLTMKEDLLALWKVWVPATFLNFAFMPMWARIPWVAGTSAIWTCILSAMRGGTNTESVTGGSINAATLKIIEEGVENLFACPVELDKSLSHICISASGPDQVGMVAKLARVVSESKGNITHSKMVRLGQEFIILMHVATKPNDLPELMKNLQGEDLNSLDIKTTSLNQRGSKEIGKVQAGFRIYLQGKDKVGILSKMSSKLECCNLSIENLTTELRVGRHGRRDFVVNCDCVTKELITNEKKAAIYNKLKSLEDEMSLDILDIRLLKV